MPTQAQERPLTKAQQKKADEDEAKEMLRKYLGEQPDEQVIYTVLLSVSSSGMSRRIKPLVITTDGHGRPQITDISWLVIRAGIAERPRNNQDGVSMGGAGMDMGFALVYNISAALYGYKHEQAYRIKHRWL